MEKYRKENKEKIKKYRLKNKERIRQNGIRYRERNKEIIKEKKKNYHLKNKQVISTKQKLKWRYQRSPLIFELIPFRKFWSAIESQERRKEYNKKYRKNNKNRIKEYWEKNKQQIKIKRKGYWEKYRNNPETKDRLKKYRLQNRSRLLEQKKKDYRIKKKHYLELSKIRYNNNKNKYKQNARNWAKQNPDKRLYIMQNHLRRLAYPFKMTGMEYGYALYSWAELVKKTLGQSCVICNESPIEVHHILHKSKYPALSLLPNNGIPLCRTHHNEVHGWSLEKMIVR